MSGTAYVPTRDNHWQDLAKAWAIIRQLRTEVKILKAERRELLFEIEQLQMSQGREETECFSGKQ